MVIVVMSDIVDTSPRGLAQLPGQVRFKADLQEALPKQIAVIFIDLDHFKEVNDRRGHVAGDGCLSNVVDVIEPVVAGRGTLYRYGGDEFAVILHNADVDEAAATAERIRRTIHAARTGGDIEVTASIGVASSDAPGLDDAAKLIDAADRAMYQSKHSGKNRVTRWTLPEASGLGQAKPQIERIKRLVDLSEDAVNRLQNDPQIGEAIHLHANVKKWEDDVISALTDAGASESDVSYFRVLGTYTPKT